MPKTGKRHGTESIGFDSCCVEGFDNVASVGAGVADTVVQGRLVLPFACRVWALAANCSALGTGGTHSVSVVKGTGAPGSAPTADDVVAAANATLIPATALATGDTPVTANASTPNAVLAKGDLLTLRAVTPATTGSFTNLKVTLMVIPMDRADNGNLNPTVF